MKWILFSLLSFAAPSVFAFSLGCTTATEALDDVFSSQQGSLASERISRLCVCQSKVSFELENRKTEKTKTVVYKNSSVYKGHLAGEEMIWLAVNGEGEWSVGERNFTLEKRDPQSQEFLHLRGRMVRGIIFQADFQAEKTPCGNKLHSEASL